MSATQHRALTDKYGYDIWRYLKAQMECAKSRGEPGAPDLVELPEDGDMPT